LGQNYAEQNKVPLLRAELRLFTRSNHAYRAQMNLATSLADLRPFTLVTYHGDGWARQHLLPLNIALDFADDMPQVLHKIDMGHGDATIQSGVHLLADLRLLNLMNGVVMLEPVFGTTEYFLLINRRSRFVPLLDELDRELLAMQADGTTAKLMAQFYSVKP
jgi:ABC-type amino acid transport substrate-binding protein